MEGSPTVKKRGLRKKIVRVSGLMKERKEKILCWEKNGSSCEQKNAEKKEKRTEVGTREETNRERKNSTLSIISERTLFAEEWLGKTNLEGRGGKGPFPAQEEQRGNLFHQKSGGEGRKETRHRLLTRLFAEPLRIRKKRPPIEESDRSKEEGHATRGKKKA